MKETRMLVEAAETLRSGDAAETLKSQGLCPVQVTILHLTSLHSLLIII
jgi:hypothetical protein